MSRKFNVGDRVKVIACDRVESRALLGRVTVITADRGDCYEVDLPRLIDDLPRAQFRAENLAPYYDGDEPASWSDCVWQPKQVTAQ